jgi:hypothetical protein
VAVGAATALLLSGACAPSSPELPSDASPAAVADRVTGSGGSAFLSDITTYEWPDDGRRAADLLSWIPRDANSSDRATAARAGTTAHALATFLADHYSDIKNSVGRNPALIQSYAGALVPYLGAMVGDPTETSGFEPLDELDSNMPRTASTFAVMNTDAQASAIFAEAANKRGATYQGNFANAVAVDPSSATSPAQHDTLARAARLLGLVGAGNRLAGATSSEMTAAHARTEVAYAVASKMLRGPNPYFSPEYLTPDGTLKQPDQVENAAWSLYDTQLANYLATYPPITKAVDQFVSRYESIAGS